MCCRLAFWLLLSVFFSYFLPVPLSFPFFSIAHPFASLPVSQFIRTDFPISLQYSVFHLSIHVLWIFTSLSLCDSFSNRYPVHTWISVCIKNFIRERLDPWNRSRISVAQTRVTTMSLQWRFQGPSACRAPLIPWDYIDSRVADRLTGAWIQDSSSPGENDSCCAGGQRLEKFEVQWRLLTSCPSCKLSIYPF